MKQKDSRKKSGTNWEKLSLSSDSDINVTEVPELDEDFFKSAVLKLPTPKRAVSLRLEL